MSIRSWPRRITDSLRQEGPWRASVRALSAAAYQAVMITSQALELEGFEQPASVTVRSAGLDDIDALVRLRREYKPSVLESRLRDGHKCFVSTVEGKVVACRWGCTRGVTLGRLPLVLPLREGEACIYEVYNDPRHRGWRHRPRCLPRAQGRAPEAELQQDGRIRDAWPAALGQGQPALRGRGTHCATGAVQKALGEDVRPRG